jgi:hypothetical protein
VLWLSGVEFNRCRFEGLNYFGFRESYRGSDIYFNSCVWDCDDFSGAGNAYYYGPTMSGKAGGYWTFNSCKWYNNGNHYGGPMGYLQKPAGEVWYIDCHLYDNGAHGEPLEAACAGYGGFHVHYQGGTYQRTKLSLDHYGSAVGTSLTDSAYIVVAGQGCAVDGNVQYGNAPYMVEITAASSSASVVSNNTAIYPATLISDAGTGTILVNNNNL